MITFEQHAFMEASNKIEGEDWAELPYKAMEFALTLVGKNKITPSDIMHLHELHEKAFTNYHGGKAPIRFGAFRRHDVRVGGYVFLSHVRVNELMLRYCLDWPRMTAWKAHVRFENIHPFEDLNGRVGRLLWLVKALEEGYDYSLPFLHQFYYQTLSKPHKSR